jgi:hypothetical protein
MYRRMMGIGTGGTHHADLHTWFRSHTSSFADWKGIPMAQTILPAEKILTGEQVGHLRHFNNNLSRLPIND